MIALDTGFSNYVLTSQIVAICDCDSLPMRKMIARAKDEGKCIDHTHGRASKAVIMTSSGYVVISAVLPQTL